MRHAGGAQARRGVSHATSCGRLCCGQHRIRRTFLGAVLTALLFGAAFVYWTYYPHGLPLPTLVKPQQAAPAQPAPPPPATAATPVKPDNPVTTISPPADSPQR